MVFALEVLNHLYQIKSFIQLISSRLCPPVSGQAAMDVVVNPPQKGDESYELFEQEKAHVLAELKV